MTTLIIFNEEMDDIIKIIKILVKQSKMKQKNRDVDFF